LTFPVSVRRTLGIAPGSKVTFTAKNGVAHLQLGRQRARSTVAEGAGLITVRGKARMLANFDAAALLKQKNDCARYQHPRTLICH